MTLMKSVFPLICLAIVILAPPSRAASTLNSAKVTQVQNEVLLQPGAAAPAVATPDSRPAVVGDMVEGTKTLVTGKKSRAELLFNDNTIARLGANSVFSFKPGSRDIELKSGFLLLHTPKGKGGANIKTPTAAASVLGTTIMLSALPGGGQKLVVLEGTATITYNGVTQTVTAGQLVFLTAEHGMSPPINIDLGKLTSSSGLMNGMQGTIGSENLINDAIQNQTEQIADGELESSGFTIGGDENGLNVVNDNSALQQALEDLTDLDIEQDPPPADGQENLAGVFEVTSQSILNYSNPAYEGTPTLTTGQNTIFGVFGPPEGYDLNGGEGDVFFVADRFRFTEGPPIEINGENVFGLNFLAFGESVNGTTSFNSILFDQFSDTDNEGGADIVSLNFYAFGGGISFTNSGIGVDGHLGLLAFGFEGRRADITIKDSSIGSPEGGLRDLLVNAFGGNVSINHSELTTSQLFNEYGEIDGSEATAGLFVSVFGGNIGVTQNSVLKHFVQVVEGYGEGYFEDTGTISLFTFDAPITIDHSQILAQSDIGGTPILVGSSDMGGNSYVLVDHSVINSALGNSPGMINLIGNNVSVHHSTINAVSATGASAPVSIVANVINISESIIRGSIVSLGNDAQTAVINFGPNTQLWTDTGVNGFFRNGTQVGNVQVGTNGQDGLVTVGPNDPVGGGGI